MPVIFSTFNTGHRSLMTLRQLLTFLIDAASGPIAWSTFSPAIGLGLS
jgi:hypothetical protein